MLNNSKTFCEMCLVSRQHHLCVTTIECSLTDDTANSVLVTPDSNQEAGKPQTLRLQLLSWIQSFVAFLGVHSNWWLKDRASMCTSSIAMYHGDQYTCARHDCQCPTITGPRVNRHSIIRNMGPALCPTASWQPQCCRSVIGPFQLYINSGIISGSNGPFWTKHYYVVHGCLG